MKNSDDLFRLITSLSKSEKRYFKLSASIQSGTKNYLRLFDAIDAQSTYDEELLKKRFDGEPFTRQLNVAKRYLYHLIMKSLRAYHAHGDASLQARELVRDAEILFEKGLERQADHALRKAIDLAGEQEDMLTLMEALAWKRRLSERSMASLGTIEEVYDAQFRVVDQYRNMLEYARLLDTMAVPTLRNDIRTGKDILQNYASHPLLSDETRALSIKARLLYNWARSISYYENDSLLAALDHTMRQIELFEQNPIILRHHITKYLSVLNNAMMMQMMVGDEEGARETTAKAEVVARTAFANNRLKTLRLRSRVFLVFHLNRLRTLVEAGRFIESVELVGEIDVGRRTYAELIGPGHHIAFDCHTARAFFGVGDYDEALVRINRITDEPEPLVNRGIHDHARLLAMVIHTELGNFELLEYLARSAYRYFHSRERIGRFEGTLISFFRRLSRLATPSQFTAAFVSLRNDLLTLESDPEESEAFRYFHYIPWIQSRIERRPFAELVRQQFEQERRAA